MTYCGYVDVVVVLILIVLSSFASVLILVMSLFLSNAGMMVLTLKIFTLGFFSDLEILFSMWSLLFSVMVLFISVSVLFFSYSYFSVNNVSGFMVLYLAFIMSMIWLIVNQNFYWMMLGWDGLGVTSFLLIIYYMNNESVTNGLSTIFQNRVGDLFLVLFLVSFGNLSMQMNFYVTSSVIFLMLGAAVKSAQYPFNTWLLAAMSAPTPISSLVHSSTLVVAGVYVMLQYSYCLMEWLDILKYMSMVTLIVSFIGLMNESDMKKLIAYSTMSHVGLMMYMFSLQLYKVVYLHLNIHAMFKSLMFMCFGFLMLASYHSQDKRLVSIHSVNPVVKMFYNFSCMCLMGLPFLSAFFSKDFILEKAIEMSGDMSSFFLLLLFLSVSVFYGMKLLSLFSVMFSYSLLEKQFLGGMSLGIMVLVMLGMVNLFISLIFSVSLELMDLKLVVYSYMLSFLVLASLMKFNYKLISVSKVNLFKELWLWNWYSLDQYVYWTYLLVVGYVNMMSSVKLLLMINWWVVVVVIFLF